MLLVFGKVRIAKPLTSEAKIAMEKVIRASNAEEDCLEYSYAVDVLDPQVIRVLEKWTGQEALAKHFQTEHMNEWHQFLDSQQLEETDISIIEGEPRPLMGQ